MSIAEWRRCGLRAKDLQPRIDDDARVMATPGPDVGPKPAEIAKLFDPLSYTGVADAFIERLLASIESA